MDTNKSESFISTDSDWEDFEETEMAESSFEFLSSLGSPYPTDSESLVESNVHSNSRAPCDSLVTSSRKNLGQSKKQTVKKKKLNKCCKKEKPLKQGRGGNITKSHSKTKFGKTESIDSMKPMYSSSETELSVPKLRPFSHDSNPSKEKALHFKYSEISSISHIPNISSSNENSYDLNESCSKHSQPSPQFHLSSIQGKENSASSQSRNFNSKIQGSSYIEYGSGSDSDSKDSIFMYNSLTSRPVNNEKHLPKRSASMFESRIVSKPDREVNRNTSVNHISDLDNSRFFQTKVGKDPVEISMKRKELFPEEQPSSDFICSQFPLMTEKLSTLDRKNQSKSPHTLTSGNQTFLIEEKSDQPRFDKRRGTNLIDSSIKTNEFFSSKPLSSNLEMKAKTFLSGTEKKSPHTLNSGNQTFLIEEKGDQSRFDKRRGTNLIDSSIKTNEFFSSKPLSSNLEMKAKTFLSGTEKKSPHTLNSGNQTFLIEEKGDQSRFDKRRGTNLIDSSIETNEFFSSKPLSSNLEMKAKTFLSGTEKENESKSDLINHYRQELEKIAEESITKVLSKKEELNFTFQSGNTGTKKVLAKRLNNLQLQQDQFEDVIKNAKNQISYTSSKNYQDIIKTWNTIQNSVKNECQLLENFFPAYAYRKEIVQNLAKKPILFLQANNAYFFNISVPLILLKHYPSHFIVSCECGETQKQYLKYSLKSSMGNNQSKHSKETFVMTELEMLNYSLKKDYAIKKMTCVVVNLPLCRSVVSDILLSNLRDMLEGNKNSKLIFIIDPNEDLTSYKTYFSMFEQSTIIPPNITYPVNTIWKKSELIPENDYIKEIVQTILSIHITKNWGNILAFIPSLTDARNVYQKLMKQCEYYHYNDIQVILVEENYYAICDAEIHKRNTTSKIVFVSVNSAEMITLPSVHFIVDCGILTDYHLDYSKNVDVLGTVFISTVKSKLRKSLAGVYGPGICYRMYSKHNFVNDMPSQEYPELLRRNPLNTLVKILKHKPNAELHKEIIEFLPENLVSETIENLKKFGAIVDNRVSLIGEKFTKLPFEAKYSKLLLTGIDFGLGFEAVILVSFLTVKGKLFKISNNPKYQRIIDAKQIELIQHQSDTLTSLHIYKIFLTNKFDTEWCKEHYIDVNFLKKVQQSVDEICETLFSCLEIKINQHFSNDEKWLMTIREIIFDCFQDNLCVYSGRLDCGFRVLSSKSIAYLPTQSIICQKDNVPQFLIFDHLLFSDKNYLINVTSIPSDLVMKSLKNGTSYFTDDELFDNTLTERVIEPVGEEVMNDIFLGENDEKLKAVIEQIKLKTQSNFISIDPSVEKGCVFIYALPGYIDAAHQALKNILKTKFEEIVNESQFHSYQLIKDQNSVILEVELAKGAIAHYVKNDANILVQPLAETNVHDLGSVMSDVKEFNRLPYSLYISWIRRHCNGNAIIDFSENSDMRSVRRLLMKHIHLMGMEIFMEMSEKKKNQLCITGLAPEICQESLKAELKLLLPAAEITHIELLRIAPFETSDKRLRDMKCSISKICENTLNMNSTEIMLPKPEPAAIAHEVFINTNTYVGLDSVADLLTIKFLEDGQRISKLAFKLRIICNSCIYQALQSRLHSELSQLKNDMKSQESMKTDFEINIEKGSEETYLFDVSATNVAVLNLVHETINCMLNGEILNENDVKDLDKIFCHGGHVWLKGLEASENIYIIMNRQSKVLRLYGSEKNCKNAKKRLVQYLKDVENDVNDIIELSSEKTKTFLLKALIQKYGIDLRTFIEECGLHQACLDIRSAKLYVYGDQASVEEASNCIQTLLENLDSVDSESILSQESCPVCLCPAINLTYRLEHCGHLYHSEPCIREFIENNEDFPIKCSAENCEKELVLKDIWKILRNKPEKMKSLIKKSIANYLERHVLDIVLCPGTDCSMFFYKNEVGDKVRCRLCQNDICIKCHCVDHGGYTCEMYQETQKDADYSYKVWARTANCKRCPRCQTAIEKSEGCNHMTCRNCSGHFCWLCPSETAEVFSTGNECYAHINRRHTGQLFDYV